MADPYPALPAHLKARIWLFTTPFVKGRRLVASITKYLWILGGYGCTEPMLKTHSLDELKSYGTRKSSANQFFFLRKHDLFGTNSRTLKRLKHLSGIELVHMIRKRQASFTVNPTLAEQFDMLAA